MAGARTSCHRGVDMVSFPQQDLGGTQENEPKFGHSWLNTGGSGTDASQSSYEPLLF